MPRKLPSVKFQDRQLTIQNGRCFWCFLPFDVWISRRGRDPVFLRWVWDHVEPYSWAQRQDDANFVASCQVCNGLKWNFMFPDEDSCRAYLLKRRKDKGYGPPVDFDTEPDAQ